MTRNRLALLLKNVPGGLLLKQSHRLLFGQFYFFLAYKKPLFSLVDFISFLVSLPHILGQRRRIQKSKRISNQALDEMFSRDLKGPPLTSIIRSKLPYA
jgi:hypothetical protein